jgi:hypothetical protein
MSHSYWITHFALATTLSLVASAAVAQQPANKCAIDTTAGKLKSDIRQTVAITDQNVFKQADFSLGRTLGAILSTSVRVEKDDPRADDKRKAADTRAERVTLLTSLVRTFRVLDRVNPDPDSRVPMPATFRPGEAELDVIELLNPDNVKQGMRPIGLFNRLDLAPASLRYCGEHRIVYGKGDLSNPLDRFFLIFEAAVDNPDPQNGIQGCRRIAQFWNSLQGKSGEALAKSLEGFYYRGDLSDGQPNIQPVVHHEHYGVPFGQVRGNLFVTKNDPINNKWMLREWRITVSADGSPVFVADTVKANPDPALYAGQRGPNELQVFADLRPEFQDNFVIDHVREVIDPELRAQRENRDLPINELLARLSARFENRFNTFESVSQDEAHDPLKRARDTDLMSRVEDDLKNFRLPGYSRLTAEHIVTRAGALSCAGCHQLSVGQEVAPNVKWPAVASGGFVHNKENGELSEALEKHFLPARCENMQRIVSPPAAAPPAAVAQASATAPTKARDALTVVQRSESRAQRIEALPNLEFQVQAARRQDFQSAGAFIPFRRTH